MSKHAKELEPKIQALHSSLGAMASGEHTQRLLSVIHQPGWTTPQEAQLVHAMLDALTHQVEGLARAQNALVAAEQIGRS